MPGDDKAAVRTVGVLGLTLFAIVALRGVVPGAPPPSPETDPGGSRSLVAVVIMLVVSVAAIAVSVLARARRPRPPCAQGEPPRRDVGAGGAIPWRLFLIAGAALLGWLLIVALLMRWAPTFDPPESDGAPPPAQAPDAAPGDAPGPGPERGGGGNAFDLLMGTAVALVMLSVIASIAGRRRRAPSAPADSDGPAPALPPRQAPDLARAAERGLAEVGDRSRDPREAIIACYLAMEQELGKSPGTVPQASDTPSEVLARAVARRVVHAGSAAQLVDLFEEARFSPHVMNEGHRDEAVRALQVVQHELQGVS